MLRLSVIILITIQISAGARILGVVPSAAYSHQSVFRPIFHALAKRGHELVVLTTDPVKDHKISTLREIDLSYSHNITRVNLTKVIDANDNPMNFIQSIIDTLDVVTAYQLEHPDVVNLIHNKTEHFDLVMAEFVFPIMFAFKHRFNCPFIGMVSMESHMFGQVAVDNPIHQVLYPEMFIPVCDDLNFFQRMTSLFLSYFFMVYVRYLHTHVENEQVKTYFGEGYPDIIDIGNSVDMIFQNANPVFSNVRPVTPATVNIGGGIHIKDPKPLPKDLQNYLDSATSGVIYFSLGSNVKSADFPVEIRDRILKVFSELPYKILWKFEAEDLPDKPDNVKILKWIPQQDLLGHPNIKVFITQGGLQSLEEALFSHVPLLVLPFYGDQEHNANKVVYKGIGLSLNHKTMTADEFKNAILEVMTNPKYKETVTKLAIRVKDEPMTPLEKAVWWTEYVVRNKGAQHLKGPGINLPLYQYYYLDIFAFIISILLVIILVLYITIKKIVKCLCKLVSKKKVKLQ